MHIPSAATQALAIQPFADALTAASHAPAASLLDDWVYVPADYRDYRYLLGTKGSHPLLCVGVNPSTAEPGALDNTLKSVSRIASAAGFDAWTMLNVYAQRATRPDDMDEACNPVLHRENLAAFRHALAAAGPTPTVWAAWGAVIEKRPYLPACVADMVAVGESFGARWVCAGACSKAGHPHHPLYLRKDEPLRPFDIRAYLATLPLLTAPRRPRRATPPPSEHPKDSLP